MKWVVERRLVLAVGLAAALPVMISTVRALLDGWNALFDDAIIATRSFDVFSSHSPLVGEHSDASLAHIGQVYSPGPLLNWLLAIPAHLPGNWALPVTMGVLNTAAIVGAVALARRRGGTALMFATAISVAAMCGSLQQEVLHAPDNSKAALIVFTLLLFLGWSVACGEYRLLPLTVLVASLVIQAHLSLAPASIVVLVAAVVGLVISVSRNHPPASSQTGSHIGRWTLSAAGAALICWSFPLVDLVIHNPGNLVRIVKTTTAHQATLGWTTGWHVLVRTIGIPPWWLRSWPVPFGDLGPPGAAATVSCVAILVGLTIALVWGARRRRRDVAALAVLALALSGTVAAYTASTPDSLLSATLVYGLRWCSPVGMFVWLALGWSLAVLGAPQLRKHIRRLTKFGSLVRPRAITVAAVGVTATIGILVSVGAQADNFAWLYRPAALLASRVKGHLPPGRSVVVPILGGQGEWAAQEGLVYQLRRWGYHPVIPANTFDLGFVYRFGAYYSATQPQADALIVRAGNTAAPGSGHEIASVGVRGVPGSWVPGVPLATKLTASVITPPGVCGAEQPVLAPSPSDHHLRVVPTQVRGFVEHSEIVGHSVQFCGWAASVRDHRAADSVLIAVDGRPVGIVRPTIVRSDIVRALGPFGKRSGYRLSVPLALVEQAGRKRRVQLFGIERGIASPLPFLCNSEPHDVGC